MSATFEPHTYQQAVQFTHWKKVMQCEPDALKSNKTWIITHLPKGEKSVGCKWIYKVKFKVDGTIKRYKARLVAKEYIQIVGFNFQETFSPMAKHTTIRAFLALGSIQK